MAGYIKFRRAASAGILAGTRSAVRENCKSFDGMNGPIDELDLKVQG